MAEQQRAQIGFWRRVRRVLCYRFICGGWRRRSRWAVRAVVAVPLVLAAAWVVLLRSPVTGAILLPAIGDALNLEVRAAAVWVRIGGSLVVDSAEVRVPGVEGRAGLILQVDRIVADVNWWRTLWGDPSLRGVSLHEPLVRISQAVEDGSLNIEGVRLPDGGTGDGRFEPPTVRIIDGALELGEHRGGVFTPLKRLSIAGLAAPVEEGGEPGYDIRLHQRSPRPGEAADGAPGDGFRIEGRWREDRFELVMHDFSLDEWPDTSIPSSIRAVFSELDLHGRISRAVFRYSDDGPEAELTLDGVAMYLPVEAQTEGPPSPNAQPLLMHGVGGTIRVTRAGVTAALDGLVEDLPYKVTLDYEGTRADSPFTVEVVSEGFKLEENPRLLPYAPGTVRRRIAQFTSPTAEVTARLLIRRGPPEDGAPGKTTVAGTIELRNGQASYEKFPYPFENLSGLIRFDDEEIDVVRITGASRSGAKVTATGKIRPPGPGAEVDLDIHVQNAPFDKAMEEAFVGKRKQILTSVFNRERHAELVEKGLVLDPVDAPRLREELGRARAELGAAGDGAASVEVRARIADLERRLSAPTFEFGGVADVRIKLHRPYGDEVVWDTWVVVNVAKAGAVPEHFPLPIVGEDVVVRVEDEVARVVSGRFRGLTGGTAMVQATARMEDGSGNKVPIRPDVIVTGAGLPIDELFINALPGPDLADGEEGFSTKRMLRDLGLTGTVDGSAHVHAREDGDLGFDVELQAAGLTASPRGPGGERRVRVEGIGGTLTANEDRLRTELKGGFGGVSGGESPLAVGVDVVFEDSDARGGVDLDVSVQALGADLSAAAEDVVAAVSASSAMTMRELRDRHEPTGRADVAAAVEMRSGELSGLTVGLDALRDVSLNLFGGRIGATGSTGGALVAKPLAGVLSFEGLTGPVTFDGEPAGSVVLVGEYPVEDAGASGEEAAPAMPAAAPLRVGVIGGGFEAELFRRLAGERMGADLAALVASYDPHGVFDADLTLSHAGVGADSAVSGQLRPRTLAVRSRGERVSFGRVEGVVDFDSGSGILRELALHAPEWSAVLDGAWAREMTGVTSLRTKLALEGRRLTPDLRAMLPEALDGVLEGIDLKVDGPISLTNGHLVMVRAEDEAAESTEFSGAIGFEGASLDVGVSVAGARGRIDARYELSPGEEAATYGLEVAADRLTLAGVQVTDARATLVNGERAGEVEAPNLSGRVHGGRLAGRARSGLTQSGGAGPGVRDYLVEAKLSGARFAPVLEELRRQIGAAPAPAPAAPLDGRTTLDAEVTLAGLVDVPSSRRGRGLLRMSDGEVLALPLVLRLIEISNLQPPLSERLDYAHASFFVDGGVVVFDDISVISRAVSLLGYGTMTWPETDLDLRFNSKSSRRIPVLSDLVEGIRDEFVTAAVLGPIGQHRVELRQFAGARRMLGRAVGADESEQSRRLEEIERLASEGPTRLPRRIEGIRPTEPASPKRQEPEPSNVQRTPSPTGSNSTRP